MRAHIRVCTLAHVDAHTYSGALHDVRVCTGEQRVGTSYDVFKVRDIADIHVGKH